MQEMKSEIVQHRAELDEVGNSIVMLCEGLLLNLASKLDIRQEAQVRMSLYVHDEAGRRFIPCGRYSPNPKLRAPGRTSYPDDQGCIARGWERRWHFDNAVPIGKRRSGYNRGTYNIPEAITEQIKMQSTLYAVQRLDDATGKSVGLIVVEAIEPDEFDENDLRPKLESVADDYAKLINALRTYIPNPSDATARGL